MTERIATLAELETHWSLDDAMRANALLDMRDALREQAQRQRK